MAQDGKRGESAPTHQDIADPLRQPQAFDLVSLSEWNAEVIVQGIYELKGEILRLSISCGGWQRPRSFGKAPLCFEYWLILKAR